jgi:hypothetical protein
MTPCMEIILRDLAHNPRIMSGGRHQNLIQPDFGWAGRPGGFGGGPAPDPIPNSAVKTPSAHGTVSQGTGE